MDRSLRSQIQQYRRESPLTRAAWMDIIAGLLDDFAKFLGSDFERDANPTIEESAPTIVQWIWSKPTCKILSPRWSAVLACTLVEENSGMHWLAVSVTLFLFSGIENSRLYTHDGKAYLLFTWKCDDTFGWRCEGWCDDEWGEWKDFTGA